MNKLINKEEKEEEKEEKSEEKKEEIEIDIKEQDIYYTQNDDKKEEDEENKEVLKSLKPCYMVGKTKQVLIMSDTHEFNKEDKDKSSNKTLTLIKKELEVYLVPS